MKSLWTFALAALLLAPACAKGGTDDDKADQKGSSNAAKKTDPAADETSTSDKVAEPAADGKSLGTSVDSEASANKKLAEEAKSVFAARCASCHGDSGKGDGPAASALNPKPRDYTDAGWQKETTDEAIEKIIVEGGPSVGKAATMPPHPDLGERPELIGALRAYIRSFEPE